MQTQLFPASERGIKDAGWLKSNFFFSFSDYFHPLKSAFGTLVAFNDDHLEQGKGFGIHPHVNMEIISILLKGKMNHKDSMGYSTTVEEGGVQIMSAGSGLRHEEYNIGEGPVNFLQIWIQPKQQNITPRYQQRSFPMASRKNRLVTILSHEEGLEHCWINQNAKLSLGYFDKGSDLSYSFNPMNKCLFVFLAEGSIRVNGKELTERDGIGIWDTDQITIHCGKDSQFLIIETPVNQK
jgi:redox-sensitive bicupin YhaK (pirin superfamily)